MAAAQVLVLPAYFKNIRAGDSAVTIPLTSAMQAGSRTMQPQEIQDLIAFVNTGNLAPLVSMHLPALPSAADAVALLHALRVHCSGIKSLSFSIVGQPDPVAAVLKLFPTAVRADATACTQNVNLVSLLQTVGSVPCDTNAATAAKAVNEAKAVANAAALETKAASVANAVAESKSAAESNPAAGVTFAFSFRARAVTDTLQEMSLNHLLQHFQEHGLDDDKVRAFAATDLKLAVPALDDHGNTYQTFVTAFKTHDLKVRKIHVEEFTGPKDKIGEGSFGEVFKWQLAAGGCVAVKESQVGVQVTRREDVEKELGKMLVCRSSHVVTCLGLVSGLPDCKMGIVLELLECEIGGGKVFDLYTLLHRSSEKGSVLTWADKFHICRCVAQGLCDIHAVGMLHRDLKCENVLVGGKVGNGQPLLVKIADFGEAKYAAGDLTFDEESKSPKAAASRAKGTMRIRAPELLGDAAPIYSEKSDTYALGILMWEVAKCGKAYGLGGMDQEARTERLLEVKQQVLMGKRDPEFAEFFERAVMPSGTKTAFKSMINKCWKQSVDDRPTASEVLKALDTLAAPPAVVASSL